MATTLAQNPQKITLADTNELELNFNALLDKFGVQNGYALLDELSASTQFNGNGVTITSATGTWASGSKALIPITRNVFLKCKGSAAATFNVTISPF